MRESNTVGVTVRFHLEYKLADAPETETAMPTRVCQKRVALTKMSVSCLPPLVPMNRSSPAFAVDEILKRVQVVLKLEMKNWRVTIAPPKEVDGVSAGDLIYIRHDQKIVFLDPREPDELVQRDPLVSLFHERVLASLEPSSDVPVRQPWLHELELPSVRGENQRFRQTGEGGVGLEDHELGDVRVELFPADGEHVDFVAEQDGVEDSSRRLAVFPSVEGAERFHGGVWVVVMRKRLKWFRW